MKLRRCPLISKTILATETLSKMIKNAFDLFRLKRYFRSQDIQIFV